MKRKGAQFKGRDQSVIITIDAKARPCPGVDRAISLTEDALRRGEACFAVGQLIHNQREVARLEDMGLRLVEYQELNKILKNQYVDGAHFLIRTHGESESVIAEAQRLGLASLDTTCPIVRHSQDLVDRHMREGWAVVIIGDPCHAEVKGLIARTRGRGLVISSIEEAEKIKMEVRSLLIAQTTIDPDFFSEARKILSSRITGLKIVDTTCRFLRNRKLDVEEFSQEQDVVVLVGGENSANCTLLHKAALSVNPESHKIEAPEGVDAKWFRNAQRIGITGGASTPRWQLEEMRSFLDNHDATKNPKGFKNRKGGPIQWRMWRNQNKTK